MKKSTISFQSAKGNEIQKWIPELASLRIQIFKDWPYLYEGNLDYEKKYLSRYSQAEKSFIALALNDNKVIGATSCIWLPEESDKSIQQAFKDKSYIASDVVYFGESILLPIYRGIGIGSEFMQLRENFAKDVCHAKFAAFCSVQRPQNHSLRPKDYISLEAFWSAKKFQKQEDMFCSMSWQDIDQKIETEKQLQFWVKEL